MDGSSYFEANGGGLRYIICKCDARITSAVSQWENLQQHSLEIFSI